METVIVRIGRESHQALQELSEQTGDPIRARNIRWHVPLSPPEAGLPPQGYVKCEDVRSVSKERLVRRMDSVSAKTGSAVEYRLRILMGL